MKRQTLFPKLLLAIGLIVSLTALPTRAQTPVAIRVKAVVKSLPPHASVVAKYTDNKRHCLYYTLQNRLYCYDVVANKNEEVTFTQGGYSRILSAWYSPDGNFLFIAIDRGTYSNFYLDDGQELIRYDSFLHRSYSVGTGYKIERRKGCYVIKKASRCLNPSAPQSSQHWLARDHYYDLYGKTIWAKEEYRVK
jgi:hypothetical protein